MKKKIQTAAAIIALSLITMGSFAQSAENPVPRWVSESGYWVVESNIHSKLNHIVRFYNNDNILVYKETLTGVKLNPSKRKVKMKLKKILESSVTAWEKNRKETEDTGIVMAILH